MHRERRGARGIRALVIAWLIGLLACVGGAPAKRDAGAEVSPDGRTAPLLEGLGDFHHPITTSSPLAQRYFDQGLLLAYGFNHAEAVRSFQEAQRLDPDAAMPHWGEAFALGPNINAAMPDSAVPLAWAAIERARARAGSATERERDYIDALATRYVSEPVADRSALDVAFADAMRDVAARHRDDPDAQVLFAEALMDTTPWDYWQDNGEPRPEAVEILERLEAVLAAHPGHPGALHFYIHSVEAGRPHAGVPAAEKLDGMIPGAGHLVHMPAHIYVRVGRYRDASDANERAIASDDDYVTQCHAQGLYPVAYMPHNHHFLWYSASMEGRSARSIEAAHHVAANVDPQQMRQRGMGTLQHFYSLPYFALARFGRWEEVLAEPRPDLDLVYPIGIWHYARGYALARTGRLDAADEELTALRTASADPRLDGVTIWDINTARAVLDVAAAALAGEIAAELGDLETATGAFREAVVLEDALNYDEPPPWHAPVRQSLGAVLLAAGDARGAEAAYRQDLEVHPHNGWSLFGLREALRAEGRNSEADAIGRQFEHAWSRADVELTASRF